MNMPRILCCACWVLFGLLIASQCGCCHRGLVDAGSCCQMPWVEKPDEASGVSPPYKQIADLRELATRGSSTPAAEQEKISRQIATAIRNEPDPIIRTEMIHVLGGYSTKMATAVLRAALKDSDAGVRITACEIWGNRGGADGAKLLGEALASDVEVDVRLAAARALGQTHDPSAATALAVALEDQDPAMQRRGVESLKALTGQNLGNDVNRWRQYVKTGTPPPDAPVSLAERLRSWF